MKTITHFRNAVLIRMQVLDIPFKVVFLTIFEVDSGVRYIRNIEVLHSYTY